MPKTRARDRILLSSGRTLTLTEALDEGLVELRQIEHYDPVREDARGRALCIKRYIARELASGDFWEINRVLYESRTGLPVSAARKGAE